MVNSWKNKRDLGAMHRFFSQVFRYLRGEISIRKESNVFVLFFNNGRRYIKFYFGYALSVCKDELITLHILS